MPEPSANTVKHISLERLELYDTLLKDYIDEADAKALKTVAISQDGKGLNFYTVEEPVGDTAPAFYIEFPETDMNPYMQKVASAIQGHVASFGTGGQVVDSGLVAADLATKSYVDTQIVSATSATNKLSKQIVTELPAVADAVENVIYMIKIPSATGNDQYEEWTLIGGQLVMIGDTSTNMSDYYTKGQTDSAIDAAVDAAKTELTNDYESKIDAALGEAKDYTDNQLSPIATRLGTAEQNIQAVTDSVTGLTATVSDHTDRIEALEAGGIDIEIASVEEIYAMFPNATPPAP